MRTRSVIAASLATHIFVSACSGHATVAPLEQAVIVVPVGHEPAALYFTLRNVSADVDTLRSVEVALGGRASVVKQRIHAPTDGGMSVAEVSEVPLAPRSRVDFTPDGLHVLLFGLTRPLTRGDSTMVTARFARQGQVVALARVITYAEFDAARSLAAPSGPIAALGGRLRRALNDEPEPRPPVPLSAGAGERLYRTSGCASCHGPQGHGDGPIGPTLVPRPRDFRDSTAFKNGTDVASIAQTIATGLVWSAAMPRFPNLSQSERESLALFIRSLHTAPPDSALACFP